MPKLLAKQKVLSGKGEVITWQDSNIGKFFYREKVKGQKRYRSKLIKGAKTMEEAIFMASDTALRLEEDSPHHLSLLNSTKAVKGQNNDKRIVTGEYSNKVNCMNIEIGSAIKEWINLQDKLVVNGVLKEKSLANKVIVLNKHMKLYLKSFGITFSNQIDKYTFKDYITYRSPSTSCNIKRELTIIKEFLKNYMAKNNYISNYLLYEENLIPKITNYCHDISSYQAINKKDWELINNYIKDRWINNCDMHSFKKKQIKCKYFRNLVWNFLFLSKNCGLYPQQILNLKWKDFSFKPPIRSHGNKLSKDLLFLDPQYAVSIQNKMLNSSAEDLVAQADKKDYAKKEVLVYIRVMRRKGKEEFEAKCSLVKELVNWYKFMQNYIRNLDIGLRDSLLNTYVFSDPNKGFEPISLQRIRYNWKLIIRDLRSDGRLNCFQSNNQEYTIFSLRTSFIEEQIKNGTDLLTLARTTGQSINTLTSYYERVSLSKNQG